MVSDGVPGHFNQSKGVLFALERDFELDVHWIELTLKHKFYRRPLTWLLNCKILKQKKFISFIREMFCQMHAQILWLVQVEIVPMRLCGYLKHLVQKYFLWFIASTES